MDQGSSMRRKLTRFLKYFERNGHTIVHRRLVPANDPTPCSPTPAWCSC
jgi:alanyl-tRNA synthetase